MVRMEVTAGYRVGRQQPFRPGDIILVPEARARTLEREGRARRIGETRHMDGAPEVKGFLDKVRSIT